MTLAGNTPLRPDYCTAACSGFATSAAPTPPSTALFHSSPPPRSTLLGSAILLGRHASPRPTPAPNLQSDHSPPVAPPVLQITAAPDNDASAAAGHLSNTLLSYSHRGWEQAQRVDPRCDATRRYIPLGSPNPPSPTLCDHLPSHTRPEIANIADLAVEGRLLQGDDDTILLVRTFITVASTLDGHYGRRSRPRSWTPSAFMCRSWPDRGPRTHTAPMPLVTSVPHAH